MNPEENLNNIQLILPTPKQGVGNYAPWIQFGSKLVYTSGQIPWEGDKVAYTGRLGESVSIEDGYKSAQLCALHAIAQLKEAAKGDLTKVKKIIRVDGHIQTAPGFYDHSDVLNGASDLFNNVFGKRGRHTRLAQGMNASPLNATTLIYVLAELED